MNERSITREYLIQLLTSLFPDLDTSPGSPADNSLITPIISRLGVSPTEVSLVPFIQTVLQDRFPNLSFNEADVLSDAVHKPMQLLLEPLIRKLVHIEKSQSLRNWQELSSNEIDDLLYNVFYTRPEADKATEFVRLFYLNPVSEQVGSGVYFTSKQGLRFYPTYPQSISADVMLLNKQGAYYYFDVAVIAEHPGVDYNVDAHQIIRVSGLTRPVKVDNLRKFSGGTREITDEEAIAAAESAITERSLVVTNGIITKLRSTFPAISKLRVIGHGDPEMTRDILTGGSFGEILTWGTNAQVVNDHDGDNASHLVSCVLADFYDLIGPAGTKPTDFYLTFGGEDYKIKEVVSRTMVLLHDPVALSTYRPHLASGNDLHTFEGAYHVNSPSTNFNASGIMEGAAIYLENGPDMGWYKITEVGYGGSAFNVLLDRQLSYSTPAGGPWISFYVPFGQVWYLRQKTLTLAGIPGGFEFGESETVPLDQVNVGGMTDIYMSSSLEDKTQLLTAVADQTPILVGINASSVGDDRVMVPGVNFIDLGVQVGDSVHILSGDEQGAYKVKFVAPGGNTFQLLLDTTFSGAFANERFSVTSSIDLDLQDPRDIKLIESNLFSIIGSDQLASSPPMNFLDYGVTAGDYLEIKNGINKGVYQIIEILGTTHYILRVDEPMKGSATDIYYTIYRALNQAENPIVCVDSIDLMDVNNEPTGDTIPYGKIIDVRTKTNLTNIGDGVRYTVPNARYGLLGRENLGLGLNVEGIIVFTIGGADHTVTFLAPLPNTAAGVAEVINDVYPDIAHITEINGEHLLYLTHPTEIISVNLGGGTDPHMVQVLGFNINFEEQSNQLLFPASAMPFNHGLNERAVVYIDNGSSGYYRIYELEAVTDHFGALWHRFLTFKIDSERHFWTAGIGTAYIGNPSTGTLRLYFKDPTLASAGSALVEPNGWNRPTTIFTYEEAGAKYNFFPDFIINSPFIPAPGLDTPNNGAVPGTTNSHFTTDAASFEDRDPEFDFVQWEVEPGDKLIITTIALCGDVDFSGIGDISGLVAGRHLTFRVEDTEYTVTFTADDSSLDDVIDTINKQLGTEIAYSEQSIFLRLESDVSFSILFSLDDPDNLAEELLGTAFNLDDPPDDVETILTEIHGNYEEHRSNSPAGYHDVLDSINPTPALDIGNLAECVSTANALKNVIRGHDGTEFIGGDTLHNTPNLHQVTAPDASEAGGWASIYRLINGTPTTLGLKQAFNEHIEDDNIHLIEDADNEILNFANVASISVELSNDSAHRGEYLITEVALDGTEFGVTHMDGGIVNFGFAPEENIYFYIEKRGVTRITPSDMVNFQDDHGFYYMDVEVVSEGIGDAWNVDKGERFEATNANVLGYTLDCKEQALSYSPEERLWLLLPTRFLPSDSPATPGNYVELAGQNLVINYKHSGQVGLVQDFVSSESERVILSNTLVKHLLPAFLKLSLVYTGGSETEVLRKDIEQYINMLQPDDEISVYGLNQIFNKRMAGGVMHPIELIAMVWEEDRSIVIHRSKDSLALGRRYEVYLDLLEIQRV